MLKTRYTAELCNLEKFKDVLDENLRNSQIENSRIPDVELAVEELIVNIINYSYPGNIGSVELLCEIEKDKLIIKIIDEGVPFDPVKSPDPERDVPLKERTRGGMGIYLSKSLIDEMRYKREDNKNILSLTVMR